MKPKLSQTQGRRFDRTIDTEPDYITLATCNLMLFPVLERTIWICCFANQCAARQLIEILPSKTRIHINFASGSMQEHLICHPYSLCLWQFHGHILVGDDIRPLPKCSPYFTNIVFWDSSTPKCCLGNSVWFRVTCSVTPSPSQCLEDVAGMSCVQMQINSFGGGWLTNKWNSTNDPSYLPPWLKQDASAQLLVALALVAGLKQGVSAIPWNPQVAS